LPPSPRRRLRPRSSAALIAVALVAVAVAPARATSDAALLARYEPVLVLHAAERFSPVAVDGFLGAAQLEQRSGTTWVAATGPLPTADPSGCAARPCWRLRQPGCSMEEGTAAVGCYAAGPAAASPPAVYGAAFHTRGRIALEYWLWYAADFWSGRYPPSDEVWQAHEGDWEAVTVVLSRAGAPLYAGYSQHECGKRRAWRRVPKSGTHPVAYVAFGSHANYYAAGDQPLDLRRQCYDPVGAAILRADLGGVVLDRLGGGRRLARLPLVPLTPRPPAWLAFPGAWGEANLFHAPDPVGTRVAGAGPLGPRFHALWRDPVGTVLRWPSG
jgi:hypothetical protein